MAAQAGSGPSWLERLLRPGQSSSRDVLIDVLWLVALALVLIGAGLGLRDPWPADEPRFALVAQDMLRSGDWLFPRVGGDLYEDKPPLFFWLMAAAMSITGSLKAGFLLPSLLAGIGTTLLTYDLLRRARGRTVALAGAFLLLITFQFVWEARHAQIDAVLCFLTTLSLYGLLRHLVLGPAPGWYVAGWAAAGLGVITKGVGFLPLLALLPFALLRRAGWPAPAHGLRGLTLGGLGAMLVAIGLWFVPMIVATSAGGELLEYRNEILFRQTVTRYAEAWHHHKPVWFYLTNVIPVLWLPAIVLLPWLWRRWRAALEQRDLLLAVLLGWVVLVVAFFSASSGKRGLYVLPAVPAFVMAAGPWLPELLLARGPRRVAFTLGATLAALAAAGAIYFTVDAQAAGRVLRLYGIRPVLPLAVAATGAAVVLYLLRVRDGWLAYAAVLAVALVTIGAVVEPQIDAVRSGRQFTARVEQASAGVVELGLVGAKEQYLLQLRRPSVNFGHGRWKDWESEAADAAAWLADRPGRALVVDRRAREGCFPRATAIDLGRANRKHWFLVAGEADAGCVKRGDRSRAIHYTPPDAAVGTES